MKCLNRASLMGNVGQDPEIRQTAGGTTVAKLSLATNEKYKDKSGNTQESVQWHRLTAFGKLAEIIGEYVHKGDPLFVEGRIEYSQSEGDDGVTRYWTDIILKDMHMLGKLSTAGSSPSASRPDPEPRPSDTGGGKPISEPDDDLPF